MEKKEVSREEFDALVEKVNKLEKITDDQTLLLQEIDKKKASSMKELAFFLPGVAQRYATTESNLRIIWERSHKSKLNWNRKMIKENKVKTKAYTCKCIVMHFFNFL